MRRAIEELFEEVSVGQPFSFETIAALPRIVVQVQLARRVKIFAVFFVHGTVARPPCARSGCDIAFRAKVRRSLLTSPDPTTRLLSYVGTIRFVHLWNDNVWEGLRCGIPGDI